MSAEPIAGDVELDLKEILVVRGAINTGIEYASLADNPITTTFDSTRLPHLEAASEVLETASDQTAPGGTFRGRLTPSEMRATRMAVGFVEAELTPPVSPVLDELPTRPTDNELARLQTALDGLTPAPDVDVAHSDWRTGVNTDAIVNLVPDFGSVLEQIREAPDGGGGSDSLESLARDANAVLGPGRIGCRVIGGAVVDAATAAAGLGRAGPATERTVIDELTEFVEAVTETDCFYEPIDRVHLETAWERVRDANSDGDRLDITLAAMDFATAWAWNMARRRAASL